MLPENLKLSKLTQDFTIPSFDCGDDDLNDFLINDSKNYSSQLIATTFILHQENKTVAFYSLLNDKISFTDFDSNRKFKKLIQSLLPNNKRFKSYPAVKIGRLGVHNDFKGTGIGTTILDYIKRSFAFDNKTGCKFITVDAYRQSLKFYEKNGFEYLTESDKNESTRLMRFDLLNVEE